MNIRQSATFALSLLSACVVGVVVDRHLSSDSPTPGAQASEGSAIGPSPSSVASESTAAAQLPSQTTDIQPSSLDDMGRALSDLKAEKNPRRRARKMNVLVDRLDPAKAEELLGMLTTSQRLYLTEDDQSLALALVVRWAAADPQGTFAYIQAKVPHAQRASLLEAAAASWASEQPKAALEWLSSVPNGELRRGVLAGIVTSAGQADPVSGLQYIASLPGYEQLSLATAEVDIFKTWATHDPQAAANRALTLPPGSGLSACAVAVAWAETDPTAAMTWIEKIPNANVRSTAFMETFETWAKKDQQAAADYILTVPAGESRDDAVVLAMRELSAFSSDAALAFFEKIPVGAGRDYAARELVSGIAAYNPQAAVSFLESLPSGGARDEAADSLARRWATADIGAAMRWAQSLPGDSQTTTLRAVLYGWSNDNPAAAASYLFSQMPAPQHQEVLTRIALSESSPEQGVVWAEQTKDPQKRAALLETLCRKWVEMDVDAAVQWIEKTNQISKETKSTLLGAVRSTPRLP